MSVDISEVVKLYLLEIINEIDNIKTLYENENIITGLNIAKEIVQQKIPE